MKVVVFGAAGGIGRQVVAQALESGYHVTAVARDPRKLTLAHERLVVAQGDVLDLPSIARTLDGAEAVVSTIGLDTFKPTTLYSQGTRNIIAAMKGKGLRRFIGVSASGFHIDENDPPLLRYLGKPIISRILKEMYADLARMERIVRDSDCDWTIIVPPKLTDGPRTGNYRVAINVNVRNGWSISRADVAHYAVAHLESSTLRPSLVFLAY